MDNYKIVIPARYGSSRLPGKPLIELAGKPMIQHVYERACETGADEIVIATDDPRIEAVAKAFGAGVMMTDPAHDNGTERIAEVAARRQWSDDTIIVNLQGDEPLIPRSLVETTANSLIQNPVAGMSSVCTALESDTDVFDPNVVKVVLDRQGFAMYFSRASIPWDRDAYRDQPGVKTTQMPVYRHIGMYGYRVSFLKEYTRMEPCALESTECLEQLRALWYGVKIHMAVIDQAPGHGVDTPEDVARVELALTELV
ncbi:MAG: 3-deoxy-manno-octulosonate cytidylyltransferase [Oceanobacter sp.]